VTALDAIVGTVLLVTSLCAAFAVLCLAADTIEHKLEHWHGGHCSRDPECLLRDGHDGLCDVDEYL
jgi:hypothetical protein